MPWRALLVGVVAGLAASAVMEAAQASWLAASDADSSGEPSTEKTANALSVALTGAAVPERSRALAGDVVHYAAGAVIGGLYGVIAERTPAVTAGFGSAYGIAVAAILDEAIVPSLGLSEAPGKIPLETHLFGFASHVVFGLILEASRRTFLWVVPTGSSAR